MTNKENKQAKGQCCECAYMGQKWDNESPCFTCRNKNNFKKRKENR